MPDITTSVLHRIQDLKQCSKIRKEKQIRTGKKEIKLTVFIDGIIVHIGHTEQSTDEL